MYWVGVLLLGIIVVAYTTSMGVIECVTIRTFGGEFQFLLKNVFNTLPLSLINTLQRHVFIL